MDPSALRAQPIAMPTAKISGRLSKSAPPAPASDEVVAAAPEYVLDGQWDDAEWRAVAAKPPGTLTEAEKYLWAGGPRPHPWGRASYSGMIANDKRATFPTKAAFDAYAAVQSGKATDDEAKAQGTLNALAKGLADGATVKPASDADQSAPTGSVAG